MKKLLLIPLILISFSIHCDMKYDPIFDRMYSIPLDNKVNLNEYNLLFLACREIATRLRPTVADKKEPLQHEIIFSYFELYLKAINSYTSLRLINDYKILLKKLKKNPKLSLDVFLELKKNK